MGNSKLVVISCICNRIVVEVAIKVAVQLTEVAARLEGLSSIFMWVRKKRQMAMRGEGRRSNINRISGNLLCMAALVIEMMRMCTALASRWR